MRSKQLRYFDYAESLRHLLKYARFRESLLAIISLILIMVISYISTHKQITLVPYGLAEKVQVAINKVSPHYLSTLATADAALYFDVNPANIKIQSDSFLTRIYPALYGSTQVKLVTRMKVILQSNLSQVFYPEKILIQDEANRVQIQGQLLKIITDKVISTQAITLEVRYHFVNGLAYIQGWQYHV